MVASAPESKNSRLSFGQNSAKDPAAKSSGCSIKKAGTNPIAINEIEQYPARQSQLLSLPESEVCGEHGDSSLGNNSLGRFRHSKIESWPQVKRRKIEHHQAHGFATSQSFRVTKPHNFQRDPDITYPKNMEIDIDTGLVVHVEKCTDDGIYSEVNINLMEGIQSAISSQHGEVQSSPDLNSTEYSKHFSRSYEA